MRSIVWGPKDHVVRVRFDPGMSLFVFTIFCTLNIAFLISGATVRSKVLRPVQKAHALEMRLVRRVAQLLGTPYRWGGTNPKKGVDCSALVGLLYREVLGRCLPRTVELIREEGESVFMHPKALRSFDLLIYDFDEGAHIGLFIKGWGVVHASPSRARVVVDPFRGVMGRPVDVRRTLGRPCRKR